MTETITTQETTPTATKSRFDIQQHVTDTIIKQLEAGTIPWQKPWDSGKGDLRIPRNAVTGNTYRGVNIILLWSASHLWQYPSNEWASLKQWNTKKESIRPKEKGEMIIFAKEDMKEIDGEMQKVTYLQYSKVFNRCQLVSYKPEEHIPIEQPPLVKKIEAAEDFVANTFAEIRLGSDQAYYTRDMDRIIMPPMESFIDTKGCTASENYYSVLFHELTHWTGHEKRLNRLPKDRYGKHAYAEEELVGELGAAFLGAELNIISPETKDHSGYIKAWLKVLKDNKQFIISAASEASKAVGFLHGLQPLKF